jgi:[glutamine synthetase] adenylyltransferase / [glutamine synthetase]-adenylyl-L-tyrosine phosphorylase
MDPRVDLEQRRDGEPGWAEPVRRALARAPRPRDALLSAQRVLAAVPTDALAARAAREPARLGELLLATCGVAPFLAAHLARHPAWLLALLDDDLAKPRTREALRRAVGDALAADPDPERALRTVKYAELARITARECAWVPLEREGEVLAELSALADALLEGALSVVTPGGPSGFAVLALGKLGARELNYSSDVDLVYVHGTSRGDAAEHFTRVAQRFGRLVERATEDGFLYRVDVELRPEGTRGPLVPSEEALGLYFESAAASWERAAYAKARVVAGDFALGERVLATLEPMIHRRTLDYAAVDAIRALKERIAAEHGRRDDGFDVKLDAGGIRDVEFVAQALQLLHAGRNPELRARGTEEALQRLGEARLLPRDRVVRLLAAHRFLRRLEHRLQMVGERQTHFLPGEPAAKREIARAFGFAEADDPAAALDAALAAHRADVAEAFEAFFAKDGLDRVFELFARRVPQLVALEPSRGMLLELAAGFAAEIERSSDPKRALAGLDRFVEGVGARRFYFELLIDRPELIARLVRLFAASTYLSDLLATYPRTIEPIFADPNVLVLGRAQLAADFEALEAECRARYDDPDEAALAALRLFRHRQVVNVGLLDAADAIPRDEAETGLSALAEVCVERALAASRAWLAERRPADAAALERSRFAVVAMGKLASREISYGSDLDLVFLFDVDDANDPSVLLAAQEASTRLAQRLISMLATRTAEGSCYDVDPRLRPSGNQGSLVASLRAFERYHAEEARVWERQALLRARPVAGDPALGRAYEAVRRRALARPLPAGAAAEVHRVRMRMERELAHETPARRDVKLGRGGSLDVETVAQYLQLLHGREHLALLDVEPTEVQLRRLAALGSLAPAAATELLRGWEFLQRLSSRLRLVENRSISDLDARRGDLDTIARRLGYPAGAREGAAGRALLADYRRHTEAIRGVYGVVIEQVDNAPPSE